MEALLSELVGASIHERCERSESLSCWSEGADSALWASGIGTCRIR